MPDLKALAALTDKMKNLSDVLDIEASTDGIMTLSVAQQMVRSETAWQQTTQKHENFHSHRRCVCCLSLLAEHQVDVQGSKAASRCRWSGYADLSRIQLAEPRRTAAADGSGQTAADATVAATTATTTTTAGCGRWWCRWSGSDGARRSGAAAGHARERRWRRWRRNGNCGSFVRIGFRDGRHGCRRSRRRCR